MVLIDLSGTYSDPAGSSPLPVAHMAIDDFAASNKPASSLYLLTPDRRSKPEVASAKERSWFHQGAVEMPNLLSSSSAALALWCRSPGERRLSVW